MSETATTHLCWACGTEADPSQDPRRKGLWTCGRCGLRFQPERDTKAVRDLYDEAYFEEYVGGGYEDDPRGRQYEARLRMRYVGRFAGSGDLLEIGVAGGWFLNLARERGFRVRGIEPAEHMAATARRRFGLDVQTAFVEEVELEPRALDIVCGWHVLEHIPNPLPTVISLREGLRPGGVLTVEVPNAASIQAAEMGSDWHGWQFDVHLAHYTPAAIRALFDRAGFVDVETETIHGADYHRPSVALRPGMLAGAARFALQGKGVPMKSHPTKKELLRAVGRRPA